MPKTTQPQGQIWCLSVHIWKQASIVTWRFYVLFNVFIPGSSHSEHSLTSLFCVGGSISCLSVRAALLRVGMTSFASFSGAYYQGEQPLVSVSQCSTLKSGYEESCFFFQHILPRRPTTGPVVTSPSVASTGVHWSPDNLLG